MARRRLIDPGVWQSGHFKRLNVRQRLLWIGLITVADDEGKLKGEPAAIRASVFPFDNISLQTIEGDLQLLQSEGLIDRYKVASDLYIRIVKWKTHQKPSHPTPSKIPDPLNFVNGSGTSPESLPNGSGSSLAQGSVGKGSEGQDRVGQVSTGQDPTAGSASVLAKASPAVGRFQSPVKGARIETILRLYTEHGLDVMKAELKKAGCSAEEVDKLTEQDVRTLMKPSA